MNGQRWYDIRAEGDEAEVLIYDDIGQNIFGEGVAAEQFVQEIGEIDASTLNVRINSIGGQVFEGLAIYNALRRHPARVVTHVDGIAASIASVVALVGEEVRMAENGFLMIHNPHGIVMGDAADMRDMADTLDKIGGSLVGIYGRKTGESDPRIRAWMDEETWFNAEEAAEAGLVDELTEEKDIEASGDLSRFTNVPDEVREFISREPSRAAATQTAGGGPDGPQPKTVTVQLRDADGNSVGQHASKASADELGDPDPEIVQLAAESFHTLEKTRS